MQLLHCRLLLNSATGVPGWATKQWSFTYINSTKSYPRSLVTTKICNGGPSYRVEEAPRATPYGLARLPNIYNLEVYQFWCIKW